MLIRDLLLTGVIVGFLPFCFMRPWVGVLVWSWIGYMNPHRLTWGFAYNMPFALMVAIATIGGFVFTRERRGLPLTREVYLLFALWGVFLFSTVFAMSPAEAWTKFSDVSKMLLMILFSLLLIQDREKLQKLIWVIGLSIGFFGLKGGVFAVLTGGQHRVLGPPESFISGNTEIGLVLVMILPILLYLRSEEPRRWLKHTLLAIFLFSTISVIITYSRGAFLGLGVVLPIIVLRSRAKLAGAVLIVIGISLGLAYMPAKWFERMETIETYEEDLSSMQRIRAWRLALRIASDYPLTGAGFRAFSRENYQKYDPGGVPSQNDAHSIYFQVLAEHGYLGLAIYVGLMLTTMLSLRRMIWRSKRYPSMRWIYNCANALEVSLIAYMVSGAFLSMSYFDLSYHLVAISIILKKLFLSQEQEMSKLSLMEEKLLTP